MAALGSPRAAPRPRPRRRRARAAARAGRRAARGRAAAPAAAARRARAAPPPAPPPPPANASSSPRARRAAAARAPSPPEPRPRPPCAAVTANEALKRRIEENKAAALARKRSRQSPARQAARAARATPPPPPPPAPRARPRLGLLRGEAVDRALALGRGDILEIHGKAGAGKSNLAHAPRHAARTAPGAKVLVVETKGRSAARASLAFLKARGGNADRARDLLVSSAPRREVLLATPRARAQGLRGPRRVAPRRRLPRGRRPRAAAPGGAPRSRTRSPAVAALSKAPRRPALTNHVSADFSDGADPSAVVAADDATFAKVATARLRLTRARPPASGPRRSSRAPRDDFGDLPSSHFAVTAAGVADAGEPGTGWRTIK
ncbi:hypothetical protein SO694_00179035 [Aureococcus anophagefferens]|uniref:Uncharacterized protein n=1 Tax=Aureococcus anophagefferens TaxID=44056 RepID=A0ABR1FI72_AURAN